MEGVFAPVVAKRQEAAGRLREGVERDIEVVEECATGARQGERVAILADVAVGKEGLGKGDADVTCEVVAAGAGVKGGLIISERRRAVWGKFRGEGVHAVEEFGDLRGGKCEVAVAAHLGCGDKARLRQFGKVFAGRAGGDACGARKVGGRGHFRGLQAEQHVCTCGIADQEGDFGDGDNTRHVSVIAEM